MFDCVQGNKFLTCFERYYYLFITFMIFVIAQNPFIYISYAIVYFIAFIGAFPPALRVSTT